MELCKFRNSNYARYVQFCDSCSVTHGIMQDILHVKLTSIYNYINKTVETLLQ